MPPQEVWISVSVVSVAVSLAAVWDARFFRIPNTITVPLILSGIAFHSWFHGWPGAWASLLGIATGGALLLVFFALGGMGAGDLKLLAGVGAWLGAPVAFAVFLVSSLLAGIMAIAISLRTGRLKQLVRVTRSALWAGVRVFAHVTSDDHVEQAVHAADRRQRVIPFGVLIAAALLLLMIATWYGRS